MFSYNTKVRVDTDILSQVVSDLKKDYDKIGNRETHEGRSKFSVWNNASKFLDRIYLPNQSEVVIDVTGESKGGTSRIYFKPSVTSLAKPFRKCIKPINPDNIFLFTDLKAAEFAMGAIFAQETEAVNAYQRGEDIYMYYKSLFPEGSERSVIKKILIANMYNKTAYSTSLDLGVSEAYAQRLLDNIALNLPNMTLLKRRVYSYDMKHQGYFAPNAFDQTDLKKVASIDPIKGFNPDYAASCYIQSALGFLMQQITTELVPLVKGTLLSVFDSVLIEHNPQNSKRLEAWLLKHFSPLLPDNFNYGHTFWESAYEKE